jgi:hypothetical protein
MKNCVCVCVFVCVCVGGGPLTSAMCWIVRHSSYLCTSKRREKIDTYVYNSRFSTNIKLDSRTVSKKKQIWKTYLFTHLICKFKGKVFVYRCHVGDRNIGISRGLVVYDYKIIRVTCMNSVTFISRLMHSIIQNSEDKIYVV